MIIQPEDFPRIPDPDIEYRFGDLTLKAGDKIAVTFKYKGPLWVKAVYLALIEKRFKDKLRFLRIDKYTWLDDGIVIYCTVEDPAGIASLDDNVQRAGGGAVVIVKWTAIALCIFGSALVLFFTIDDITKLAETPAVKAVSYGWLLAAAALVLYMWSKRK